MDILHYFEPVDFGHYADNNPASWKFSMGRALEKTSAKLDSSGLRSIDAALIGVRIDNGIQDSGLAESPEKIRGELYTLAGFGARFKVADLGNLRTDGTLKGIYLALRDITDYLSELKIPLVVIGGSQDLTFGISEAFKGNRFFTLSVVDALLDVKKGKETFHSGNFLTRIFTSNPDIFQFSLLGYQSHFISGEMFGKTKGLAQHLRLGLLREDLSRAEPVLRNTDVLSFDFGAVKYSEAPGNKTSGPNGLRSEEACQLARYAGLSNRMKVFGLFEANTENDTTGLTAGLAAQMIWYFLEGVSLREDDFSDFNERHTVYSVEVHGLENPLVFYCNKALNRWWMEVQKINGSGFVVACSPEEYKMASANEIPDVWLKYVQKSDEMLK